MALSHHYATHSDQRCRREAELIRAEQSSDDHIAARLQLTVNLYANSAAQIVHHQGLLRFGKPEFPRNAGMLNGAERRCAGAAIVSADQNHISMRLRNACCNGSHPDFRDQLYRDTCSWTDVLEVVNQLRQIFNRVNIMMRRRRD